MINPKQLEAIKQKILVNVPITFDKVISLLSNNNIITQQSRLLSSSSRTQSP
jgi:hypothetical protein